MPPLPIPSADALVLAWFFLCWAGYAYYADHGRWGTRASSSFNRGQRAYAFGLATLADPVTEKGERRPQ